MRSTRRGCYLRLASILVWLALVPATISNEQAAPSSCGTTQGDEEILPAGRSGQRYGNADDPEDHALILANYFKRLDRPSIPLAGWQAKRFAFEDGRAAEFEALRVDEYPCEFQIPRTDISGLSTELFREEYESKSLPVMITGIPEAAGWSATERWTWEGLEKNYGRLEVKVAFDGDNPLKMRMDEFLRYARAQTDDSPLYVFDQEFVEDDHGRRMAAEYSVPELFPEDLFDCMQSARMPFRWLLVGPKRSGTRIHIDPLGTSAWNTLLSGRKLWLLAPPGTLKAFRESVPMEDGHDEFDGHVEGWEGDGEDEDGYEDDGQNDASEAIDYFLDVLPGVRERTNGSIDIYTLVQHPGETIFVPSGWPHAVLNLDDTVAVTQNFVSSLNFERVWLSTRRQRPTYALDWLQKLVTLRPDLALRALQLDERDEFDLQAAMEREQDDLRGGDEGDEYEHDHDYDDEYDEHDEHEGYHHDEHDEHEGYHYDDEEAQAEYHHELL